MRKAVIVTGASRGLGRAVALKFGREGWNVIVNFFASNEKAEEIVGGIISSGGDAFSIKADVKKYPEVEAMVEAALNRFGRLDVLVNSAGITRSCLIPKLDIKEYQDVIDINLKGCFNTIKAVSRPMMKQRSGHIINISSIQGVRGKAGQAAYAASKAGLIGLTKAAAVELAPRGIQVNAVLPGYMLTDMGMHASDKEKGAALNENLLKRYSEPDEVAAFIYHLAGMEAVSGQVFNLDSRII